MLHSRSLTRRLRIRFENEFFISAPNDADAEADAENPENTRKPLKLCGEEFPLLDTEYRQREDSVTFGV